MAASRLLALVPALVAAVIAAAAAAGPLEARLMLVPTGFFDISVEAPRDARTGETIKVCVHMKNLHAVYVERAEVSIFGIEPSVSSETLLYHAPLDYEFRKCFVGNTSAYPGFVWVHFSIDYVDSRKQSHHISVAAPVTVVSPIPLSQFEYVREQYEKCEKDRQYWYEHYLECANQRQEYAVRLAKLAGECARWEATAKELNSSYTELLARYRELRDAYGALGEELAKCRIAAAALFAMLALATLALPALWAKARKK